MTEDVESFEHAMDLMFASSKADWEMASRGTRLADFDGRDSMAERAARETVPCQVVMEDGDRCGQTAPRFGPYAGRCDDHREEEAPTWDPELLAALRPAASIPVAAIDNGDELAGEEAFDDETMELVMAVAEAKYAFDAAQREVNDRMDALVRSIKAISVE